MYRGIISLAQGSVDVQMILAELSVKENETETRSRSRSRCTCTYRIRSNEMIAGSPNLAIGTSLGEYLQGDKTRASCIITTKRVVQIYC